MKGARMTEQTQILDRLNQEYDMDFEAVEFLRDSGCTAYAVHAKGCRYFLRVTKPMFSDTARRSLDIHLFLQEQGFSVPRILFTKDGSPCVKERGGTGSSFYVLYEFIEGTEVDPEQDAEATGAFVGKLHKTMKGYPGAIPSNGRHYYLDRYLHILRRKQYARADEFAAYGERLWKKVKDLPYGYCHGDMYRGNILKTAEGRLYILDFDTSCRGLPMYDLALICNMTDYFQLENDGWRKSQMVYERFLPQYLRHNSLSKRETEAFPDLIALYHFALQATIIEIFGMDCVDEEFFHRQLAWLYQWQEQCGGIG